MTVGHGPRESVTIDDEVLPKIAADGWSEDQVTREFLVKAKDITTPSGATRHHPDGSVDIVLSTHPGTPTVAVEAKRSHRTAEAAIQQAIRYAEQLDVPLAYGTNGGRIIERNLRTGVETEVDNFTDPVEAWANYCLQHGLDDAGAALLAEAPSRAKRAVSGAVVEPRYYQTVAINRVLRAIARGGRRVLLLMATGTGKTFTAMQIVHKLREHAREARPDRNYRVLYLADRDQLLTQPMKNDFIPAFGTQTVARVRGSADPSREIFFASYQALTGDRVDTGAGALAELFKQFRPDFFDLVIVDECHRGSADADSSWRAVLDHFAPAVQLGLTATPKGHGEDVVSYQYFGDPVFRYSLADGIQDGYLAPYRVRRVVLTPDADGWSPTQGELDRFGTAIPPGQYGTRDFERVVKLLARTRAAAEHLSKTLRVCPTARAIVFCVDVEHATEMRQALIAANPDLVAGDPEWVVRIVGVEGERERLLDEFTDPERNTPVVATTSRLLSTGVDVPDLKYVVLFRPIGSMIEFKQIIGRGTRLCPDKGKFDFEIIDYAGATRLFSDPDFDGFPADIVEESVDEDGEVVSRTGGESIAFGGDEVPRVEEPDAPFTPGDPPPPPPPPPSGTRKYYVDRGDFGVAHEAKLVAAPGENGLQLTDYATFIAAKIQAIGSQDAITLRWSSTASRKALREALAETGVNVGEIVGAVAEKHDLTDIDPLDALFAMAFNQPPRTRAERVRQVRERHFADREAMTDQAREVLDALLGRYETHGVEDLESLAVLRLSPLNSLGTPVEIAKAVGGNQPLQDQLAQVQRWLYEQAA